MDVTPSYSSVWRGRDGNVGGWRPGRSRLNISGLIGPGAGAAAPLAVSARLHPLPCLPDGVAMFGPLAYSASTAYRHNSEGTETDAAAGGGGQPAEILGLKVSAPGPAGGPPRSSPPPASQVAGSATFPFLVDYDASGSVVLYADETAAGGDGGGGGGTSPVPLACCNLSPPPPDFPEEWSAVIEANVRDKGYTMVVRQLYSASNKKVRLDVHSLGEFSLLFFFRGSRSGAEILDLLPLFPLLSLSLARSRARALFFLFLSPSLFERATEREEREI